MMQNIDLVTSGVVGEVSTGSLTEAEQGCCSKPGKSEDISVSNISQTELNQDRPSEIRSTEGANLEVSLDLGGERSLHESN